MTESAFDRPTSATATTKTSASGSKSPVAHKRGRSAGKSIRERCAARERTARAPSSHPPPAARKNSRGSPPTSSTSALSNPADRTAIARSPKDAGEGLRRETSSAGGSSAATPDRTCTRYRQSNDDARVRHSGDRRYIAIERSAARKPTTKKSTGSLAITQRRSEYFLCHKRRESSARHIAANRPAPTPAATQS